MSGEPILAYIKKIKSPVFTTFELSSLSGKSLSVVTQSLSNLEKKGLLLKIYRGIWAESGNTSLSPYSVVPYLFIRQRGYVSFLSALHLYGIIDQIPQTITLASTAHTWIIRTKLGVFFAHKLAPEFFSGFDWYKGDGSFLVACPEKALVDCLYLSACKSNQFGHFPELHFPKTFSFKKAGKFVSVIPNANIRFNVQKKLKKLIL